MRQRSAIFLLTSFGWAAAAQAAAPIIQVPAGSPTLTAAIAAIPDGGIIELAAGTYLAPAGGFLITNPNKRFTIRAAPAAVVTLSGNNTSPVLKYQVTVPAQRGHVIFEDLTFANGRSTTDGVPGGFLLDGGAQATFRRCTVRDNTSQAPTTGGGGGAVFNASKALFSSCVFQNNTARNEGGGLRVSAASEVWIDGSQFLANSCALPNHRNTAAGGAIHIGDAKVWVTNARFAGNAAGYVGGAIYAIGTWLNPVSTPHAEAIVSNCTFVDNTAARDPSVAFGVPTEGGAIHAEDQATVKIYNSRFLTNTAGNGGALSLYRAIGEVQASVFRGNRQLAVGGFGGAIQAISRDTTADGATNRRSVSLAIADSLFQGRYGAVTTVGEEGGAIFIEGDYNRMWAQNGVSQEGTLGTNRATLTIDQSAFADLDVTSSGGGEGGAIAAVLAAMTVNNSLFVGCDALGTNGGGGALRAVIGTAATVTGTTFVANTAALYGGAVYVQGADFNATSCQFLRNEVSPGMNETVANSYGAALFTGILPSIFGTALSSAGTVASSLFSDNVGLPILDDDGNGPTYNDLRYNNNQFYNTTFGTSVYRDTLAGGDVSPAGLNALTVTRTSAPATDKSTTDNNSALGSAANVGQLLAVPPALLATTASGDASPTSDSYLVYGWSGSSASLDGSGLGSSRWGVVSSSAAVHTLNVAGSDYPATIDPGAIPTASLGFSPPSIVGGGSATLSWGLVAGTFLASVVDQGISTGSVANGSTSVTPNVTRPYTLLQVTREGGDIAEQSIFVDEAAPLFADGFENGSTSAWQP